MKPQVIPQDLKPLVLELKKIRRFVNPDYPEYVFQDDVYQHTLRCVALANLLAPLFSQPHFPINLSRLKRILWLHDTVEIGLNADFPAPDKAINPDLENYAKHLELHQANKLLSPADYILWQEFEAAKNILSGQLFHHEVFIEAILARIIDVLDGNIHFNRSLVRWLLDNNSIDLPSHSLIYAFQTNHQYHSVIARHPDWYTLKPLLEAERLYIQSLWQSLSWDRIPASLHPHLNH